MTEWIWTVVGGEKFDIGTRAKVLEPFDGDYAVVVGKVGGRTMQQLMSWDEIEETLEFDFDMLTDYMNKTDYR